MLTSNTGIHPELRSKIRGRTMLDASIIHARVTCCERRYEGPSNGTEDWIANNDRDLRRSYDDIDSVSHLSNRPHDHPCTPSHGFIHSAVLFLANTIAPLWAQLLVSSARRPRLFFSISDTYFSTFRLRV